MLIRYKLHTMLLNKICNILKWCTCLYVNGTYVHSIFQRLKLFLSLRQMLEVCSSEQKSL